MWIAKQSSVHLYAHQEVNVNINQTNISLTCLTHVAHYMLPVILLNNVEITPLLKIQDPTSRLLIHPPLLYSLLNHSGQNMAHKYYKTHNILCHAKFQFFGGMVVARHKAANLIVNFLGYTAHSPP